MKRLYVTVFLISCAVLMLEISLARLFSISLSYHFAFMVISIAMLGIGSAGTILALSRNMTPRLLSKDTIHSRLSMLAMLAGCSIPAGYSIINGLSFDPVQLQWDEMQIAVLVLYCFVLSVPFFFSGMLIAVVFSVYSEKAGLIYGADLVGAGTGSVAVTGVLFVTGPEHAILTASLFCFCASLVTAGRKARLLIALFIITAAGLVLSFPVMTTMRLSPYKNLSLALQHPGAEHLRTYHDPFSRIDTLRSPAIRFAPGLSLTYLEPLPEQVGISIDGGEISAITGKKPEERLVFLEYLPSSLPYVIKRKGPAQERGMNVLVLEARGGLQALTAHYYAATVVHAVESNRLLLQVVRDEFREFSGDIYGQNAWSGMGRSLIQPGRSPERDMPFYDILDFPMTGVSASGAFGIAEDYRVTLEAFSVYLDKLRPGGIMSVSLYIIPPPRIELRILTTLVTALEQNGVKNPSEHIVVIRSWGTVTILVKNTPFTPDEIAKVKGFAKSRRFDLVHYPGIQREEANIFVTMPTDEYYDAFQSLLDPVSRDEFIDHYLFAIEPVHDEDPFFHSFLKLNNIKAIYEVMGQKWQFFIEEGYLLPVIFIIVFLLSAVLILLPAGALMRLRKNNSPIPPLRKGGLLSALLYFAMLGIGFMFIEVTLIQKNILVLLNPSYAFATVLTSILISSGIGSMASSRVQTAKTVYVIPAIIAITLLYSFTLPVLLRAISLYSLNVRVMMVFVSLLPIGFFLGIPFPAGIKILGMRNKAMIPWAWAVNGCLSVLAPILTIMLAMASGFQTVLWCGAGAYLIAFFSLRRLLKEERVTKTLGQ